MESVVGAKRLTQQSAAPSATAAEIEDDQLGLALGHAKNRQRPSERVDLLERRDGIG
jgi:hypothetical protein